MAEKCVECGKMVMKVNTKNQCEECARKDESLKSYFTRLFFINESCARLVPAT